MASATAAPSISSFANVTERETAERSVRWQHLRMYNKWALDDDKTCRLWEKFTSKAQSDPTLLKQGSIMVSVSMNDGSPDGGTPTISQGVNRGNLHPRFVENWVTLENGRVVQEMAIVLGLLQHLNPVLANRILDARATANSALSGPLPMEDSHKGVYGLVAPIAGSSELYVGSTGSSFGLRMHQHLITPALNQKYRAAREEVPFEQWKKVVLADFGEMWEGCNIDRSMINAMEISLIVLLGSANSGLNVNVTDWKAIPIYGYTTIFPTAWLETACEKIHHAVVRASVDGVHMPTTSVMYERQKMREGIKTAWYHYLSRLDVLPPDHLLIPNSYDVIAPLVNHGTLKQHFKSSRFWKGLAAKWHVKSTPITPGTRRTTVAEQRRTNIAEQRRTIKRMTESDQENQPPPDKTSERNRHWKAPPPSDRKYNWSVDGTDGQLF